MCVINETISACVLTDLSPASSPDQSSTVLAASDAALVDTSGHDHDYISTYSILSSSAVACMPAGTSDNELVLPSVNANTSMSRPASRQESLTSDVLPVAQLQDSDSLSVTPGSSRKRYHAADMATFGVPKSTLDRHKNKKVLVPGCLGRHQLTLDADFVAALVSIH